MVTHCEHALNASASSALGLYSDNRNAFDAKAPCLCPYSLFERRTPAFERDTLREEQTTLVFALVGGKWCG